jgi:ABC-2 type transport system ATP-binding protein
MSDETAFSFEGVTKRFDELDALTDVTLAVPRGSVVGLVGRNGAGKTTAIRCLLGLQRPTRGSVRLLGHDPRRLPVAVKQRLGYLSDAGVPFPSARPEDLLRFCAPLYPRWDHRLEHDLVARFGIPLHTRLSKLSPGQQRAVALALALCPRPDVLVLDEPAANLDAVMRREFLQQVLELVAEEGRTVLFSSHDLNDVERIADRLAILHQGRLLLHASVDELQERTRRLRLRFPGEAPLRVEIPGAVCTRRSGRELLVTVDRHDDAMVPALERRLGAQIEVRRLRLEDLFIDLVGGADEVDEAA